MDILNVGLSELIFIFVIALMVFGPRRLPEIAAKAGKYVADLRRLSNGLLAEWQREINVSNQLEEFQKVRDELHGIKQDLTQAKRDVGSLGQDLANDTKQLAAAAHTELIGQSKTSPESTPTDAAESGSQAGDIANIPEPNIEDAAQTPAVNNGAAESSTVPRTTTASVSRSTTNLPTHKSAELPAAAPPDEVDGGAESQTVANSSSATSVTPSPEVADD